MDQVESINCHLLAGEDLLPIDEDLYICVTYDEGPVVAKSKVRGKSSQPVWDQWVSLGAPPVASRTIYLNLHGSKTDEAYAYATLSLSQGMPGRHRLPLEPVPSSSNYKKLSKMQAGSLGYLIVEIGFVLKESPSDTPPERSTMSLAVSDSQNILQEAAWKLSQEQNQQRTVQPPQPTYPSKINIEIIEARKLTKGDLFSSDPYVKGMWVSQPKKEVFKTHYVGSTVNPTWNSKHSLTVPKGERAIFLEVWDKDTFTDDFLGVTTLHLNKFGVQELQLEDKDHNRLSSILVVRVENGDDGLFKNQTSYDSPIISPTKPPQQQQQINNYQPHPQPQTIPTKPPQELLSANSLLVTVVRAWSLASTDTVTADPYVELTFDGQTKAVANTKVKECTLTPEFNETLKITVPTKPGGGYPDLLFTILDADMVGKDDFMGHARLAVHKDMDGEHKLALQPRSGNKDDEKLAKKNNGLGYLLVNVVSNLRSVSPAVVPMKPPSPQPNIYQPRDTPSPPPKPTPPPPINYYQPPPSPPPFIPPKYEEVHIPKPPPAPPVGPLIRQTDYESVFVEIFEGHRLYRPTKSELPNCLVTLAFGREPHCAITRSIPFSKDPEWFESFQLNIPNQEAILVFRVIDISLGTHDLIGEGRVVLRGNCNGTHRLVLAKTGVPSTRDLGEIVVRVHALRRGEGWPHATSRSEFRGLDIQESRTQTAIPSNLPEEEYHHRQALLWRQHVGPDRVIIAHPVSNEVKMSEEQKKRKAYEEYQRELEKLEQKAREFEKKQREVEASISRSIEGSTYLDTTLSKTSYIGSTQIETTQTRNAVATFSTIPTTLSASTFQNGTVSTTKSSSKVAKPSKYSGSTHPLPPATISPPSKISTYKLPERERYDPEIERIYQQAYEEAYQEAFINTLEQPNTAITAIHTNVGKPAAKRLQYSSTGVPEGPRGRSKTPVAQDQNIVKTSAYNRSRSLSPNQARVATGPKKTISKQQVQQPKVSQELYWKEQQEKRLLPTELRNIRDPRELANSKKKGAAFGSSTSKRFGPMPTSKYIDDFRGPVIQRI